MKDAIIVLGGGIDEKGFLPNTPKQRVQKGAELWKLGIASKIIMSGRWSFWFEETKKFPPKTEAEAMREYAESLGVPSEAIITETESKDTIGNAYFVKTSILEKNNWKNIAVVTSDFHLARTQFTFDLVMGPDYKIEYVSIESNLTPEDARSHQKKEEQTIGIIKKIIGNLKPGDNEQVGKILFTKHPGYSPNPEYSFEQLKQLLKQ